jgi:hypothetical protein
MTFGRRWRTTIFQCDCPSARAAARAVRRKLRMVFMVVMDSGEWTETVS